MVKRNADGTLIFSVKEMAQVLGLSSNGVRYLESEGVVSPHRIDENGYRQFSLEDQSILYMYKLYREAGLQLGDIKDALLSAPDKAVELMRDNTERMARQFAKSQANALRAERLVAQSLEVPSFAIGARPAFKVCCREMTIAERFGGAEPTSAHDQRRLNRVWIEHIPYAFFGILITPNQPSDDTFSTGGTLTAEPATCEPVGCCGPSAGRPSLERGDFHTSRCMVIEDRECEGLEIPEEEVALHLPALPQCLHATVAHRSDRDDVDILAGPLRWLESLGCAYTGETIISRFTYLRKVGEVLHYVVELWIPFKGNPTSL